MPLQNLNFVTVGRSFFSWGRLERFNPSTGISLYTSRGKFARGMCSLGLNIIWVLLHKVSPGGIALPRYVECTFHLWGYSTCKIVECIAIKSWQLYYFFHYIPLLCVLFCWKFSVNSLFFCFSRETPGTFAWGKVLWERKSRPVII